MTPRRTVAAAVALVVAVVALAGCSDDDGDEAADQSTSSVAESAPSESPASEPTPLPEGDFPANDVASLKAVFDPLVEPLGLRLTRGGLVDRSDGYEFSDTGTHLALYVEPIDDEAFDDDRYVEGILTVAAAVTPTVFAYTGVESFDICQEPPQSEDSRYEPFPVTQIEMTRANADGIDWDTLALVDFVTLLRTEDGARLLVGADLAESEPYRAVLTEGGFLAER